MRMIGCSTTSPTEAKSVSALYGGFLCIAGTMATVSTVDKTTIRANPCHTFHLFKGSCKGIVTISEFLLLLVVKMEKKPTEIPTV